MFEAIKLAQDKAEDRAAQKSALLLHASSNEISWRMIDRHDQLLAKLAVRDIDFRWLNRQDGSTVNNLAVGDLQAFDGAADAEWTEILAKYDETSNHPLAKVIVSPRCSDSNLRLTTPLTAKALLHCCLDSPSACRRYHYLRSLRTYIPPHAATDRHTSRWEDYGIPLASAQEEEQGFERGCL